jgi:hypothetical protein
MDKFGRKLKGKDVGLFFYQPQRPHSLKLGYGGFYLDDGWKRMRTTYWSIGIKMFIGKKL